MHSDRLMYLFSKPVVRAYTNLLLELDILRHDRLPKGAKIIAANHPSTTDPFFVSAMLGHQSFILINQLLFQVPLLGAYLSRSGHIPVAVGQGQQAIDAAAELLSKGRTVIIFPEGDLSPERGGFLPARTGVGRLALLTGAPVIPVGIHLERTRAYTVRSTVRGQVSYGRWYPRGPYHMTTGKPLLFSGSVDDREQVRSVSKQVMHHIIELARESEMRMEHIPPAFSGLPVMD